MFYLVISYYYVKYPSQGKQKLFSPFKTLEVYIILFLSDLKDDRIECGPLIKLTI